MLVIQKNSSFVEVGSLRNSVSGLQRFFAGEDPENADFMQAIGAAPRMGMAVDIFAVRTSIPEKIYELAGHVYEDGRKKVKFIAVPEPLNGQQQSVK